MSGHRNASCIAVQAVETRFPLRDSGSDEMIDYLEYGYYLNLDTDQFQFVTTNLQGLAEVSGDGVDPSRSVYENPEYKKAAEAGKTDTDWWKHVTSSNPQLDFFVWVDSQEEPGVRQFYLGKVLERAGHLTQALKAYRACMMLYPDAASWSSSGEFSWSIAEGAWNQIMNLTHKHPELGVELVGANVTVRTDDFGLHVRVKPGKFITFGKKADAPPVDVVAQVIPQETMEVPEVVATEDVSVEAGKEVLVATSTEQVEVIPASSTANNGRGEIVMQRGTGTVQLVKFENGDWEMRVEGEPYFVKAVVYDPTKVGMVPWEWNWMWADDNTNGTMDVLEVWMDRNNNGNRDENEPVVSDFGLLREMGGNTIKTYNEDFNIHLMRKMFHDYGIRVIVGDFVGAYCRDSGASWEDGTDYLNSDHRKSIKDAIRGRVERICNEPWLLGYILGNENNMPSTLFVNATRTNANKYPEAYARFLNELADMIHGLDPNHPVGVGNLMTGLVEFYEESAPALDFIGVNCYIGPDGFGSTWEKVKQTMDRPVLITEYGCDSYYTDRGPDEEGQSDYHMGNWRDIIYNRSGNAGSGNSIGGCLFEWVDEWWKDNKMKQVDGVWVYKDPLDHHHTAPTGDMAFPDGKTQEEWLGITGQGKGASSPFLRVPKKAFYSYKEVWNEEK